MKPVLLQVQEAHGLLSSLMPHAPHPCDREYMSTGAGPSSPRLFIRNRLGELGWVYTRVPHGSGTGRVKTFLPASAGQDQEEEMARRLGEALGEIVEPEFEDLPACREAHGNVLEKFMLAFIL